jgi:hypothetical protein
VGKGELNLSLEYIFVEGELEEGLVDASSRIVFTLMGIPKKGQLTLLQK